MIRVVGAAIVRDGLLLAARRTAPAAVAGRWELPGGKVEDGETDPQALVREIEEELAVRVEIEHWLPGVEQVHGSGQPVELRVGVVRIIAGDLRPAEHDKLRWLAADELDRVEWLEPDRPFVAAMAAVLRAEDGCRLVERDESGGRQQPGDIFLPRGSRP